MYARDRSMAEELVRRPLLTQRHKDVDKTCSDLTSLIPVLPTISMYDSRSKGPVPQQGSLIARFIDCGLSGVRVLVVPSTGTSTVAIVQVTRQHVTQNEGKGMIRGVVYGRVDVD